MKPSTREWVAKAEEDYLGGCIFARCRRWFTQSPTTV
jgi:hypothetical protein